MKYNKLDFVLKGGTIGVLLAVVLMMFLGGIGTNNVPIVMLSFLIVIALFARKGTRIDFENKKIQECRTLFFFVHVGTWYEASSYKNFQLGNKVMLGESWHL